MDPRAFLDVAFALAHKDAPSDGDLRTAVSRAEKANGQARVLEKVLRHLDPDWTKCFAA